MKGRNNPYTKFLKQPVTIRLDRDSIEYFKSLTEETGIPYQTFSRIRSAFSKTIRSIRRKQLKFR